MSVRPTDSKGAFLYRGDRVLFQVRGHRYVGEVVDVGVIKVRVTWTARNGKRASHLFFSEQVERTMAPLSKETS